MCWPKKFSTFVQVLTRKKVVTNSAALLMSAFNLQVVFRNEQSGEYLFYYVTFKAVPPGVMATIDLSTPIRKSTSHVVTLHNPLSTPVTFNSQCSVADIQLPPNFTVPPLSEVSTKSVIYIYIDVPCYMTVVAYHVLFVLAEG